MKCYEIPLEGNDYYYNGLRANLLALCTSLAGVSIYSIVKSSPDGIFSNTPGWVAIIILMLVSLFIFFSTKFMPNRFYVFEFSRKPTHRKKIAMFWYASLQLSVGVFCSFFFDYMFSAFTLRLFATTMIFLLIYFIGMNEFAKNAVEKSVLIK